MNFHGMPQLPENRDTMTPVMFVSKDRNVAADLYMESDTEEIYLPDRDVRNFRKHKLSTTTEDESGVIGYQKYLHIVNRIAVDNTDANEPHKPELSHFMRVSQAEE